MLATVTLNFSDGSKICSFKTRKSQGLTQVKPALGYINVTSILSADYYYKTYSVEPKIHALGDQCQQTP